MVSLRILRSVSAWARPRPSAIASAKLAKRTVNQSQSDTEPVNQSGGCSGAWTKRSRSTSKVVSALPTSTTNMTGFLATMRGDSLRKLSPTACTQDRAIEEADRLCFGGHD